MSKPKSLKNPSSDSAVLPSEMTSSLTNYIRAGYPGLYIVSPEEQRVEAEFKAIAQQLNYSLHFWSVVDGLVDVQAKSVKAANDPMEALQAVEALQEQSLVVLRDFHLFLADPNPFLLRKLKDTLLLGKLKQRFDGRRDQCPGVWCTALVDVGENDTRVHRRHGERRLRVAAGTAAQGPVQRTIFRGPPERRGTRIHLVHRHPQAAP